MVETPLVCRRLCFVGTDLYVECALAARKMGEHTEGRGKIAVVGVIDENNLESTTKTQMFISQLASNYPTLQVAAVRGAAKTEIRERAFEITLGLLREFPDLAGIFANTDETMHGIAAAVAEAGVQKRICIVGYGNEPHIMDHTAHSRVTYALLHNRFSYGYDAVIHLYNYKTVGVRPRRARMLTNPETVTAETVSDFWRPDIGFVVRDETKRYLARPVFAISDRPLRFALHLEGTGTWFEEIIRGAREAVKLLPNTVVEVNHWEIDGLSEEQLEARRTAELNTAFENGYDGVILWLLNEKMIPHINRVVDRGMDVVVFHTEPVSYESITPEVEEVFASLFQQMTLREHAEQRLRRLSNEDALTGLCNRRRINERIEEEFLALSRNKGAELSVLMLDLDHFKHINDEWGHFSGDICLKVAADLMRSCIRRSKDTAARWGGEEFIVVLPNTDLDGAARIAEQIRCKIAAAETTLPAGTVRMTVSIGVVCTHFGPDTKAEGWEALVRRADDALYEAKAAGRNRVVCDTRQTSLPIE